jgi:hypothetical protein
MSRFIPHSHLNFTHRESGTYWADGEKERDKGRGQREKLNI